MSIRPLDMQVMVPKLQEVASMRHTENQKGAVSQNNIANTMKHQTEHNQQSVVKSDEDQKPDAHADAKDEGKNKYGYSKPNSQEKQDNKSSEPPRSYHKIDIQI